MTDWAKFIRRVAPHADPAIARGIIDTADEVLARFKVTGLNEQSDCFAHILVESKGLTKVEEDLNYRAERLHEVWPNRFPTVASAQPYARNPKALALKVYGGRMGNRPGTEDGWTNRGSGLLQCTGRQNQFKLAQMLGISVEECADRLRDPHYAFECAVALYVMLGALAYGKKGDIVGSTHKVNGGENGLAERKQARTLVRACLQNTAAVGFLSAECDDPAPPKSMSRSKTTWATVAGGGIGVLGTLRDAIQPAIDSLQNVKGTVNQIAELVGLNGSQLVTGAMIVIIVGACGFIVWDRRRKLIDFGV